MTDKQKIQRGQLPSIMLKVKDDTAADAGIHNGVTWKIYCEREDRNTSRCHVTVGATSHKVSVHLNGNASLTDQTQEICARLVWSILCDYAMAASETVNEHGSP